MANEGCPGAPASAAHLGASRLGSPIVRGSRSPPRAPSRRRARRTDGSAYNAAAPKIVVSAERWLPLRGCANARLPVGSKELMIPQAIPRAGVRRGPQQRDTGEPLRQLWGQPINRGLGAGRAAAHLTSGRGQGEFMEPTLGPHCCFGLQCERPQALPRCPAVPSLVATPRRARRSSAGAEGRRYQPLCRG